MAFLCSKSQRRDAAAQFQAAAGYDLLNPCADGMAQRKQKAK